MKIKDLREDIKEYLKKHKLEKKFEKSKKLFETNPFYPSLNTEILEPKHLKIYSFRIDKKYRAIFIYLDNEEVEIIAITNHYK
jgi:Txe/YoeB family toxin of Txe-Axe toxin-antitoxin module